MFLPVLQRSVSTLKCFTSVSCPIKSAGLSTSFAPFSKIGPTKDSNEHYDVIIVGGGAAGLSMACALCKYIFMIYDVLKQ